MFPPVTDRWLTSLVTLSFVCAAASALAEQGDRDKPIQIEADRASLDQLKGLTVYEGNVVVTQGTILLRAAQVTVTQGKNGGGDVAVARGNPATFRQKIDGKDEWMDAQGQRIEYDSGKNLVKLFDNARVKRGQDIVIGSTLVYNTKDETFAANGGTGQGAATNKNAGRVTVILQPKNDGKDNKDKKQ